jgi:predicted transcriptional regulator
MLARNDVMRGLALHRPDMTVREVMPARFPMAIASEDLDQVLGRLPPDGSAVVVFEDDQQVGLSICAHASVAWPRCTPRWARCTTAA